FVPTGETWTIEEVYVEGVYFSGSTGSATSVNVTFYFDSATLPGAAVPEGTYTNVSMADVAGDFTITLPSSLVLTAGIYWVSVQANMDFTTSGQWGWRDFPFEVIVGAVWRNPGGGFMT